jgi:hypothetical protein
MGTDAWSAFQAMPTPQKIALGAGIPMALYGVLSGLFGEGGVGSLLMTVLGLGATAGGLGLFGGQGPLAGPGAQIPGMSGLRGGLQSFGDLLHLNDAPGAPPAQQPPAAGPDGAPTAQGGAIPPTFWKAPRPIQQGLLNDYLARDPRMAQELDSGAWKYKMVNQIPGAGRIAGAFGYDPETMLADAAKAHGLTPEQMKQLLQLRGG